LIREAAGFWTGETRPVGSPGGVCSSACWCQGGRCWRVQRPGGSR
jgi:hypothetical protein